MAEPHVAALNQVEGHNQDVNSMATLLAEDMQEVERDEAAERLKHQQTFYCDLEHSMKLAVYSTVRRLLEALGRTNAPSEQIAQLDRDLVERLSLARASARSDRRRTEGAANLVTPPTLAPVAVGTPSTQPRVLPPYAPPAAAGTDHAALEADLAGSPL